ncbi:MAG: hypothetical protein SPJ27_01485 [Candidatus Onthovivens sp.]|nr:hypothetical protein [Candidatus Onthovivens sp.]
MTERLTMQEVIYHCEETTQQIEYMHKSLYNDDSYEHIVSNRYWEHRQVAEWLRKLQSYEDLGFTPEDIVMMAKFYKEQTSVEAITSNMKLVQKLIKLENYETLEKEGRLIVKPAEEEVLEDNV